MLNFLFSIVLIISIIFVFLLIINLILFIVHLFIRLFKKFNRKISKMFNTLLDKIVKNNLNEEIIEINRTHKYNNLNFEQLGKQLEDEIYYKLLSNFDNDIKVFRNVYFKKNYQNKFSEIDLLLIHKTGIYVIEAKNLNGEVFLAPELEKCKYITSTNKMQNFKNPIIQNLEHIKTLNSSLNLNKDFYKSYVVFGHNSILKDDLIKNYIGNEKIVNVDKIIPTLEKDFMSKQVFNDLELNEVYKKIFDNCNFGSTIKKEHIKNLKKI